MGKFSEYIGSQFGNPRGPIGLCCCLIMNSINRAMYHGVIREMEQTEPEKVLDIGYGNGYLLQKIFDRYGADLSGIDISEDMMSSARKRNQKAARAGRLHLTVGDCCALEFAEKSFDAVTSVNTIYFWSDARKGLQEVQRVLKEGGCFYNAVYSREWLQKLSYTKKGFRFFEQEELLRLGKEAGFSEVTIRDISAEKSYLVICKK